jgi:hypothetical protein
MSGAVDVMLELFTEVKPLEFTGVNAVALETGVGPDGAVVPFDSLLDSGLSLLLPASDPCGRGGEKGWLWFAGRLGRGGMLSPLPGLAATMAFRDFLGLALLPNGIVLYGRLAGVDDCPSPSDIDRWAELLRFLRLESLASSSAPPEVLSSGGE